MRSQKLLNAVGFTIAILLSQNSPFALAIPNPIDNGDKASLPEVPPTPQPPDGNRQPGGGLGEPTISVCPAKSQELTAITPLNVQGQTLSAHPTFWFYVPYTADEVESGQFEILTQDEFDRIYKTSFKLPEQPGFISITLPEGEAPGLQEDQYYHWYLTLSCVLDESTKTDLTIDGWVQRLPATPELEAAVMDVSPDIWYDSFDYLAKQLKTDASLGQRWTEVLTEIELDDFTQEPLVGPVMLTDE
ncbi:MAG: DUF928 domain-containing protein [Cyanobacteria bacterium P01_C01_bin.118]